MFPASSTRSRMLISKMGDRAVLRRKQSGSVDRLNHNTGQYEDIGTILCAPYNAVSEAGKTAAGELDIDQSTFAVPIDEDVRTNDRIVYGEKKYEVESVTTRQHYLVLQTTETN